MDALEGAANQAGAANQEGAGGCGLSRFACCACAGIRLSTSHVIAFHYHYFILHFSSL